MSTKVKNRTFRAVRRRTASLRRLPKRLAEARRRSRGEEEELLHLIRTGVEKFILKNATVEEFIKSIRAVTEREKIYSHQLTRSVFSKIVKEAIKKRNLKRSE